MVGDIITKAAIPGVKDINLSELVRRVEALEEAVKGMLKRELENMEEVKPHA
jgi:hypothetical protein